MSTYIPASELADAQTDRTRWHLELPEYAPADRIGVNVNIIDRIARLGGLGQLAIATFDGDVTRMHLETDQVGNDGSATAASKLTVNKADLSDSELKYTSASGADSVGEIRVNMSEIYDTLSSQKSDALRSSKAWAKILDRSLSLGTQNAVRKNLITPADVITFVMAESGCLATVVPSQSNDLKQLALNVIVAHSMLPLINPIGRRGRLPSFSPVLRLDHLAIAKAIGATTHCVKAL
jgi:hypothetical protein